MSSEPLCIVPVFPLPNVVLFPKVQLPLHIFEPRYREMVRDAMDGERMIGMALLKGDWQKEYYANPQIFSVGCVGKIVGHTPFPDGRCNILLHGLNEYEVAEEILNRTPYRQAKVALRRDAERLDTSAVNRLKPEIVSQISQMAQPHSPLLQVLADSSVGPGAWLNLCCFSLDLVPMEKQTLLEAKSLEERASRLVEILRFTAAEKRAVDSGAMKEGKLPH
jgi:Lon protease-like protein